MGRCAPYFTNSTSGSFHVPPLTDQIWLKRMLTVHGPGCVSATTEKAMLELLEPSEAFVAAGDVAMVDDSCSAR
jgi:hypothetical protein